MQHLVTKVATRYIESKFRLRKPDENVIRAFVAGHAAEGTVLSTNGKVLTKSSMGIVGETFARWRGSHIVILSEEGVRSDQVIIRYLEKIAGKDVVKYTYEKDNRLPSLTFETGGDSFHRGQYDGWIKAYFPETSQLIVKKSFFKNDFFYCKLIRD